MLGSPCTGRACPAPWGRGPRSARLDRGRSRPPPGRPSAPTGRRRAGRGGRGTRAAAYGRRRASAVCSLAGMGFLIYGDSVRSPALRHEVPIAIVDPFLYLESNGTRAVVANALERPRLAPIPNLELLGNEELG